MKKFVCLMLLAAAVGCSSTNNEPPPTPGIVLSRCVELEDEEPGTYRLLRSRHGLEPSMGERQPDQVIGPSETLRHTGQVAPIETSSPVEQKVEQPVPPLLEEQRPRRIERPQECRNIRELFAILHDYTPCKDKPWYDVSREELETEVFPILAAAAIVGFLISLVRFIIRRRAARGWLREDPLPNRNVHDNANCRTCRSGYTGTTASAQPSNNGGLTEEQYQAALRGVHLRHETTMIDLDIDSVRDKTIAAKRLREQELRTATARLEAEREIIVAASNAECSRLNALEAEYDAAREETTGEYDDAVAHSDDDLDTGEELFRGSGPDIVQPPPAEASTDSSDDDPLEQSGFGTDDDGTDEGNS